MLSPKVAARVAIFLLLSLGPALVPYASGNAEGESLEKLRLAEKLIEEKEYNRAIMLLTEIARKDPDKFEGVERLMQRIRSIRFDYNSKYDELIQVLFVRYDPEQALKLIEELQQLDPNPDEATAKALLQAREGTELAHFLNQFNRIMEKGSDLLTKERYLKAIDNYLAGYEINKDKFDQADYGNIIRNSVEVSLSALMEATAAFKSLTDRLTEAENRLAEVLSGVSLDPFIQEVDSHLSDLERILELRDLIRQAALGLRDQNQRIKSTHSEAQFDLFLYFATHLALGRAGDQYREGIVVAVELWWASALDEFGKQVMMAADSFFFAALEDFDNGNYQPAQTGLRNAYRIYSTALGIQSNWARLLLLDSAYSLSEESRRLAQRQIPDFLLTQERLRRIQDYRVLMDLDIQVQEQLAAEAGTGEGSLLEALVDARAQLVEYEAGLLGVRERWQEWSSRYRGIARQGYKLGTHQREAQKMVTAATSLTARLQEGDQRLVQSMIALGMKGWQEEYEQVGKRYEEGLGYAGGIEVEREPKRDEQGEAVEAAARVEKYPNRALELFSPALEELRQLEKHIEEDLFAESLDEHVLTDFQIKEQLAEVDALKDRIAALSIKLGQSIEEARENLAQAERFKREGFLRLGQAREGTRGQNLEQAKVYLQDAQNALVRSLSFQEDAEVREAIDRELLALAREIEETQKGLVVREVRKHLVTADRWYDQDDFPAAEQEFLMAKSIWDATFEQENPEIQDGLEKSRNALAANTGREIAETDPLYTEMSQLYNLASRAYVEGKTLQEERQVQEALLRFEQAEEKLEIIKQSFPNNRDARILSLRIDQIKDQAGFNVRLSAYYDRAVDKIPNNPREAYVDLQDLKQIQPDYPGLSKAIYDLEIRLGIRVLPPSETQIAESRDLYNEARSIVDRGLRELFPVALEQLNRAIEIYSGNQEALRLKDTLLIAAGGTRTIALGSDASSQFREAEQMFLEGSYFEALAIVERLLRNQRNRSYQPLLDLKKRIETKI